MVLNWCRIDSLCKIDQAVDHVHFHVIPKTEAEGLVMNWNSQKPDMEKLGALGKELAEKISKM